MTQHRTAARRVIVSLSCFAYHKILRLLPISKVGGIPGPEAYHKKNAQRRRLRRNSLPNEDFRLERLYQHKKARFSSNWIFKLHSAYSILKARSLNFTFKQFSSNSIFNFNLRASFAKLFNFKWWFLRHKIPPNFPRMKIPQKRLVLWFQKTYDLWSTIFHILKLRGKVCSLGFAFWLILIQLRLTPSMRYLSF